jgi:hypothetical protein
MIETANFRFQGGLIVSIWCDYYDCWLRWFQPALAGIVKIFRKIFMILFISGFMDHNKGRHWDRKLRKSA